MFLVRDASQKRQIIHELAGGSSRRLLFTRTKHQARKLARELTADGIPAVELHGNLSQNARERGLTAFADGKVRVMVATDIAARGIHVDDIDLVVHVDPPAEHKAYLHRSGRTARAGNEGDVITLVLPEQRRDFQAMARAAKITAQPASVHSGDATVLALVGSQAAPVAPGLAPTAAARKGDEQIQQPRRSNSEPAASTGKAVRRPPVRWEPPPQRRLVDGPRRCRGRSCPGRVAGVAGVSPDVPRPGSPPDLTDERPAQKPGARRFLTPRRLTADRGRGRSLPGWPDPVPAG